MTDEEKKAVHNSWWRHRLALAGKRVLHTLVGLVGGRGGQTPILTVDEEPRMVRHKASSGFPIK